MEPSFKISKAEETAKIFRACSSDLRRYFTSYTHCRNDADDMVQELFLRLMSFDIISSETARSLVFLMARRMIVDDARHKACIRRQTVHWNKSCVESTTAIDLMACKEIREAEKALIARMPKKRAAIYCLSRFEDKKADEIAMELSLSKRTVEAHLYSSRKEIREQMRNVL